MYQKLDRFSLGSITPNGFLKEQMLRGKDGMAGHLYELEPEMIEAPFIRDFFVKAWGNGDQEGWGAEISGNYWSGYIQYAYTLNDSEMIKKATEWVSEVLKRQKKDGYLGTYLKEDSNIYDDYNAWGVACMARGLIAFYEATKREDVLNAVYKCMLWFCENWAGDKKTSYAGHSIIEPMIFVYKYIGDERLVKFSEEYLEYVCRNDIFSCSYKAMLNDEFHFNSNHTAGLGVFIRMPALTYCATGKKEYLRATERRIEQIRKMATQLSGSPVSVTEYLGPVGATTETEYCSYAFYNALYSYMNFITGDSKYGDYMEEMFYNGTQGARKKDEKAIAYLNSPNQVYASDISSVSQYDMQVYAPCYPTACCPVNSVAVIPEFVRGMMLRDNENNVYVSAYCPCSLNYEDISIDEETLYPFRNNVKFCINCKKNFSLFLKKPFWAEDFELKINNNSVDIKVNDLGYIEIKKEWEKGDIVEIVFETKPKVITVDDSNFASKFPLAIKYGALLFAYHIPEVWTEIAGKPMTPLPDGWSWYKAYPKFEEADCADAHERFGLRSGQYSWNIALDEDITSDDIQVELLNENGYVWETPPIKLRTHCYKAPYMCAPYEGKTFEPFGKYQYVTDRQELVLEPYGCTNLRITYFPRANLKKGR